MVGGMKPVSILSERSLFHSKQSHKGREAKELFKDPKDMAHM